MLTQRRWELLEQDTRQSTDALLIGVALTKFGDIQEISTAPPFMLLQQSLNWNTSMGSVVLVCLTSFTYHFSQQVKQRKDCTRNDVRIFVLSIINHEKNVQCGPNGCCCQCALKCSSNDEFTVKLVLITQTKVIFACYCYCCCFTLSFKWLLTACSWFWVSP